MLEYKATIQRVLTRLEGTANYNIRNTSRTELSWFFLKKSEPCNFSHGLASCPSANLSDEETCPVTFLKWIKFHLIDYMYMHECSNHKENQLYHLISLKEQISMPPSCPCFQDSNCRYLSVLYGWNPSKRIKILEWFKTNYNYKQF